MPSLVKKRGKRRYVGTVWVDGRRGPTKWFPDDSRESYKAAIVWERDASELFKKEIAAGETATASLTVEKWVNGYLDFVMSHNFARKTYDEKRSAFRRLADVDGVRPDMPVAEIDRFFCARMLGEQMVERSGYAVNKDRKNLGAAWRWGQDNLQEWPIGENPFLSVNKKPEIRHPRYVPPEEHFWRVYDYVAAKADQSGDDADIQDSVMLMAYLHLAARRSELFNAKWTDVDFARRMIRLWTRKREGGALEFDWLPMTVDLSDALKEWSKRRMVQATIDHEHLFVCLSRIAPCGQYYGKPFEKRLHTLKRWCAKAGVSPAFGWHGIRHLTASTLYRRGYSQAHIQAVLRHKSPTTTARYLRSIGLDDIREVLDSGLQRECNVIQLRKKMAS